MTRRLGVLIVVLFVLIASACQFYFIEFGERDFRIAAFSHDLLEPAPDLILGLGTVWRPLHPGEKIYFDGGTTFAQRGIYARHGYGVGEAAVGGIVCPIILSGAAILLMIRMKIFRK